MALVPSSRPRPSPSTAVAPASEPEAVNSTSRGGRPRMRATRAPRGVEPGPRRRPTPCTLLGFPGLPAEGCGEDAATSGSRTCRRCGRGRSPLEAAPPGQDQPSRPVALHLELVEECGGSARRSRTPSGPHAPAVLRRPCTRARRRTLPVLADVADHPPGVHPAVAGPQRDVELPRYPPSPPTTSPPPGS